jgi:hypothetical protein
MKIFASSLILIFFFTSCTCNDVWCLQKVETDCRIYNSSRLSYHSPQICGLDIEFIRGEFGIVGFVSTRSMEIPLLPNSVESLLVILIEEQKYIFECRRLAGAQRLLLPPEATELILHSLESGVSIFIAMHGFGTEVPACNFKKKFDKFLRVRCSRLGNC